MKTKSKPLHYGLSLLAAGAALYGVTATDQAHAATLTTLVEFNNNTAPKGLNPWGGLVQGTDGNFYGLTADGGANSSGTAFKMTPAGVLTTLVEFNNTTAPKGRGPLGSLVQGTDGNFYGLSYLGGVNNKGTAFKMTPAGALTTLVEFNRWSEPKGAYPQGSLVRGTDGNFYGLAQAGGANDYGTAFKMTAAGVLTTLVEFNKTTAPKGQAPLGSLVRGTDGNFYGLTKWGGTNDAGTAFKMTPAGVLTTLVEFNNTAPNGAFPEGSLVQGTDGNFYGVTGIGGLNNNGTVFKMTPAGVLTTLVLFNRYTAPKGSGPSGSLVQGTDGSFYGTTAGGGDNYAGTAFRMTPAGALTTLVEFNGTTEPKGSSATGSLAQGTDGNFYGMTQYGGANDSGTAFKLVVTAVAQVPVVAIVKSGGNAIISWPADAAGYVLDQTSTLLGSPIPWTLVPQNTYQTNGSTVSVTAPAGPDNQFFRLRKQ